MSVRDLFVEIGFDINEGPLNDLDSTVDDIKEVFKGMDGMDVFGDIEDDARSVADEFKEITRNARTTDNAIDDLNINNLNVLERETRKAGGAMDWLKKTIVGVGVAIGGYFAVDTIKDFATESIEAAANYQAMEAQFEQVFSGMEDVAKSSMQSIADENGIISTRLQGSFTKIAAFAKTTGMDTTNALSLTERATRAAADSAAFYDRSIEDVTENLQSFLKGNFENDAALGLSATEFTRNAAAMELYGKQFTRLNEDQKMFTLLHMVEEANELSGAIGQAARESDQYENVMGNLKQSWTDFQAEVGIAFLPMFIELIQMLTGKIGELNPDPLINLVQTIIGGFSFAKDVIDAVYDTIMSLVNGTGDVAGIWTALGIPPEIAESIAEFGEIARETFIYAKDVVMQFVNDVIIPLMPEIEAYIGTAFGYIKNVVSGGMSLFEALGGIIRGVIDKVIIPLFPVMQSIISTAFNIVSPILRIVGSLFNHVAGVIKFLVMEIVVPLLPLITTNLKLVWGGIKPILDGIAGAFNAIADAVQWVIDKVGKVGDVLSKFDIGGKISGVVSKVTSFIPGYDTGLGRVPYDDMPALLHKDEAVIQADEADLLRKTGILDGDGRHPTINLPNPKGDGDGKPTPVVGGGGGGVPSIFGGVHIHVVGGNTNAETSQNIKQALQEFFDDLGVVWEG